MAEARAVGSRRTAGSAAELAATVTQEPHRIGAVISRESACMQEQQQEMKTRGSISSGAIAVLQLRNRNFVTVLVFHFALLASPILATSIWSSKNIIGMAKELADGH